MWMCKQSLNCQSSIVEAFLTLLLYPRQVPLESYKTISKTKIVLVLSGCCSKPLAADVLLPYTAPFKMDHIDKCITGIIDLLVQDSCSILQLHG